MPYRIVTSHPIGQRTFECPFKARRVATAFGIPVAHLTVVKLGTVVPMQKGK